MLTPRVTRIPTSRRISASRFCSARAERPAVLYCDADPADLLPDEPPAAELLSDVFLPEDFFPDVFLPEDRPVDPEEAAGFRLPAAEAFLTRLFAETPRAFPCLPLLCANDNTPLPQCR
jgi:hypothetical protein